MRLAKGRVLSPPSPRHRGEGRCEGASLAVTFVTVVLFRKGTEQVTTQDASSATRSFASLIEVDPRSRETRTCHPQTARSAGLGLFGLTIPRNRRIGLDPRHCAVEEERGKTNYGFATLIGNHTVLTAGIVALCNSAQKRQSCRDMRAANG